MRPRYYMHMFDDNFNGVLNHRSSELINRIKALPPWTKHTKQKRLTMGQQATATRLANQFVKKLKGGGYGKAAGTSVETGE